uniref:cyclin-L1-like n=1 Tax=Ciona intestinalis TaxID=7719 RepID=UPI000180B215|nr:cyclin-L1-like [Ciona intestinalis]|eukprot:XP_002128551.1 cyclin-L1-like [Ciona intestinalis]
MGSVVTDTVASMQQEYAGVKLTLENCLFPTEKIEHTPSSSDGLNASTEEDLRLLGCEYIQEAGIMLKVPQVAMANAQVLFQRFFFAKSFVKNKMEEVAMACIWLASKVEEAPRRVRDVINVFHYIRQRRVTKSPTPMQLDSNYIMLKNNVIKSERRLLKELGFCVHVKHPHKIIVVYLQVLEMEKNRDLVQTAWNYMNDSLRTTVFVRYTPETIACACIYMAARVLQVPLPNQPHWFCLFNATEEDIQQICMDLMRLYQHKKATHDELEKQVDIRRKFLQQEKAKAREAAGLSTASVQNSPVTNSSPFQDNASPKRDDKKRPSSLSRDHRSDAGDSRSRKRTHHSTDNAHERTRHKRRERSPRSLSGSRSPAYKPRHHDGNGVSSDLPKSYSISKDRRDSSEEKERYRHKRRDHSGSRDRYRNEKRHKNGRKDDGDERSSKLKKHKKHRSRHHGSPRKDRH